MMVAQIVKYKLKVVQLVKQDYSKLQKIKFIIIVLNVLQIVENVFQKQNVRFVMILLF